MEDKTVLDRYRVVPRIIALLMAGSAVVLTWLIVSHILDAGVESNGELTAVTAVIIAMITASTTTVQFLGRAEGSK